MTETLEKNREILKKRAAAMAAPTIKGTGAGKPTEFLEFGLAGERYAVELALVREVCAGKQITHIPGAPPFMAGVANIRGRILPVADLAVFFGIPAEAPARREIVILRRRGAAGAAESGEFLEIGILADTIRGVSSLSPADIQPPPPGFSGIFGQYLGGVTPEGLIIFLADRFLATCHEAAQPAGAGEKQENTGGEI